MKAITFQSKRDNSWRAVDPGVEFCVVRQHEDGGQTVLVRLAAGADARLHDHPGGEETYLISGELQVGEHTLLAGDYLYTPPGIAHAGHAPVETVLFLVLPGGLRPLL
jgi:quercetin dioxygenase-like cupin family protein